MQRLKKVASEIEDVKNLLQKVFESSEDLKDTYYVLFNNLNVMYELYPELYKQLEMVVKLPTNNDADEVVNFDKDLRRILENFKDEEYLKTYINPEPIETTTE